MVTGVVNYVVLGAGRKVSADGVAAPGVVVAHGRSGSGLGLWDGVGSGVVGTGGACWAAKPRTAKGFCGPPMACFCLVCTALTV